MREPRFYPHRPKGVEVIETHISTVFIAGDRVYKVKEELFLPFLDYGTLEHRRHFCHEEVRLNRRLAPDVYLGVRAVVPDESSFALADPEDPSAVEYAVEMRRLPDDRALDHLIESGSATAETVRRVARRIAEFHDEAIRAPEGYGGPADAKTRMDENLVAVLPWVGSVVDQHTFTAVERFCSAFVLSNRELLANRVARGRVCEGHGDLRAEHVVLEDARLTVYDCVESHRFVWRARLPVVLVFCGVGASGKSMLAEEISRRSGLPHLSSDVIRKGLAGVPVEERGPSEIYEARSTMLTYDDLLVEALEFADSVGGAVIDATFSQRQRRRVLADAVRLSGARVLFCECRAPEAVLRERALVRERAPERGSDATWDIIRSQIEGFEPLDEVPAPDHLVLRTDRPIEEALHEVEAFVSRAIEGSG